MLCAGKCCHLQIRLSVITKGGSVIYCSVSEICAEGSEQTKDCAVEFSLNGVDF